MQYLRTIASLLAAHRKWKGVGRSQPERSYPA